MRWSVWIGAALLTIWTLVDDFPYISAPETSGAVPRFLNSGVEIEHVYMRLQSSDFLPQAVLCLFSIYTGVSLWRCDSGGGV